ncbi:MAG: hypothetical protein JXQ87_12475 [Bacteroidia bacterium]
MRNFIGIIALLTITGSASLSKAQELGQGNAIFSLGHGFASPANALFGGLVEGLSTDSLLGEDAMSFRNLGPYYLKGEYMLSDNSGLGINLAYISNRASWNDDIAGYNYSANRSNLSILIRYNYYLMTRESFELYGGIGAGLRVGGWRISSDDPTFSGTPPSGAIPLGLEATLGFRVYPIEKLSIYGELGASKGLAQFGIAYRL